MKISQYLGNNRPLPSPKNHHFKNEAKRRIFLEEISFICMKMKKHFHIKGWARNLVWSRGLGDLEMAY